MTGRQKKTEQIYLIDRIDQQINGQTSSQTDKRTETRYAKQPDIFEMT